MIVTGGDDGTCRVWVVEYPEMAAAITDAYVQTALKNQCMNDKAALRCCHILWGHEGCVVDVQVSTVCDIVCSGDDAGIVCIHALRRGKFIRLIDVGSPVVLLALGDWGEFVVYTEDGFLATWTVNGCKIQSAVVIGTISCMELTNGGKFLVVGTVCGKLYFYTTHDLKVCLKLDFSNFGGINCLSFTPPDNSVGKHYGRRRESCMRKAEEDEIKNQVAEWGLSAFTNIVFRSFLIF